MNNLIEKYGIKITHTKMPNVLAETLKRIVFKYNPKFDGNSRKSCCEIISINGDSWIVPREIIQSIKNDKLNPRITDSCIRRSRFVAYTLENWNLCKIVDRSIYDSEKAKPKNKSLASFALEALKHNDIEVNKIHRFNFSLIIEKIMNQEINQ